MSRRNRGTKERRAVERARKRRDGGDPRPYMIILKEERDRLGIIIPLTSSRKVITVTGTGDLL